MNILRNNLFESILFDPVNSGANKLFVISGYATPNMVVRHFEYAKAKKKSIEINLIAGMYVHDGILRRNHVAFKDLNNGGNDVNFNCDYITSNPPIHSKVYAWYKDDSPVVGFIGSANYTQNAFSSSMREALYKIDASHAKAYYDLFKKESLNCLNENIENYITLYDGKRKGQKDLKTEVDLKSELDGLEQATLTLVDRYGNVPERSGLNWGQREGREPNQAYINIPANIGRSAFFPDRYVVFTVLTDDDKQLICVRAQDGGKGLQSTLNNSLLGEYFRNRLGLGNGEFVTTEHLLRYGRKDVDFHKIDEETYYLDFSVNN